MIGALVSKDSASLEPENWNWRHWGCIFSAASSRAGSRGRSSAGTRSSKPEGFRRAGADASVRSTAVQLRGVTYVVNVPMLVFSLSSEDFPVLRLLQPRAALRVLEVTRGRMVRSLKDLSPLDFSNSTMKGEIGFRSLIAGAGVFELTLMDFGWSGWTIVTTVVSAAVSCFRGDGWGDGLSGEAVLTVL